MFTEPKFNLFDRMSIMIMAWFIFIALVSMTILGGVAFVIYKVMVKFVII